MDGFGVADGAADVHAGAGHAGVNFFALALRGFLPGFVFLLLALDEAAEFPGLGINRIIVDDMGPLGMFNLPEADFAGLHVAGDGAFSCTELFLGGAEGGKRVFSQGEWIFAVQIGHGEHVRGLDVVEGEDVLSDVLAGMLRIIIIARLASNGEAETFGAHVGFDTMAGQDVARFLGELLQRLAIGPQFGGGKAVEQFAVLGFLQVIGEGFANAPDPAIEGMETGAWIEGAAFDAADGILEFLLPVSPFVKTNEAGVRAEPVLHDFKNAFDEFGPGNSGGDETAGAAPVTQAAAKTKGVSKRCNK